MTPADKLRIIADSLDALSITSICGVNCSEHDQPSVQLLAADFDEKFQFGYDETESFSPEYDFRRSVQVEDVEYYAIYYKRGRK